MLHVGLRNENALGARQRPPSTDVEEAFDFLINRAHGLDLAMLIYRAGDGKVLAQRQLGQRRQNGIELG